MTIPSLRLATSQVSFYSITVVVSKRTTTMQAEITRISTRMASFDSSLLSLLIMATKLRGLTRSSLFPKSRRSRRKSTPKITTPVTLTHTASASPFIK
jgi:hypothetical protein